MISNNPWTIVKNRYRLSSNIQMKFEFSFPDYTIGKCRLTVGNVIDIKTKKISLSLKGLVFSDTIPHSWFTSSVLIPWEKIRNITLSDTNQPRDGVPGSAPSSENWPPCDDDYCTLALDDPQKMTIDLPWTKEFTDYVRRNELLDR